MDEMKRGKIIDFRRSMADRSMCILFVSDKGKIKEIPCQYNVLRRKIAIAYGSDVLTAEEVDIERIKGKEVYYDEKERLDGFIPIKG